MLRLGPIAFVMVRHMFVPSQVRFVPLSRDQLNGIEEALQAAFGPLRHGNKKKWPGCSWQYGPNNNACAWMT